MRKYLLIIVSILLILALAQNAVAFPWGLVKTSGNEPVTMLLLGTFLIALGGVARKRFK